MPLLSEKKRKKPRGGHSRGTAIEGEGGSVRESVNDAPKQLALCGLGGWGGRGSLRKKTYCLAAAPRSVISNGGSAASKRESPRSNHQLRACRECIHFLAHTDTHSSAHTASCRRLLLLLGMNSVCLASYSTPFQSCMHPCTRFTGDSPPPTGWLPSELRRRGRTQAHGDGSSDV